MYRWGNILHVYLLYVDVSSSSKGCRTCNGESTWDCDGCNCVSESESFTKASTHEVCFPTYTWGMERNVVRTVTRPFRFIICEKGVARETRVRSCSPQLLRKGEQSLQATLCEGKKRNANDSFGKGFHMLKDHVLNRLWLGGLPE